MRRWQSRMPPIRMVIFSLMIFAFSPIPVLPSRLKSAASSRKVIPSPSITRLPPSVMNICTIGTPEPMMALSGPTGLRRSISGTWIIWCLTLWTLPDRSTPTMAPQSGRHNRLCEPAARLKMNRYCSSLKCRPMRPFLILLPLVQPLLTVRQSNGRLILPWIMTRDTTGESTSSPAVTARYSLSSSVCKYMFLPVPFPIMMSFSPSTICRQGHRWKSLR